MLSTQALKIFLTGDFDEAQRDAITNAAPDSDCRYFATQEDLEAHIEEADIVAGSLSPGALERAKNLKWVHSWMAGPDRMLYPEMTESPVILTCSKGNGAIPLAEHAMMLMLMLNRNALRWLKAQEESRWDRFFHGELNGLTCGIIGLGYSGQDLALKAKAFHMRVIGMRRHSQLTPNVDELFPVERLKNFLGQADFVVVTAPRTPETVGMLGEEEFRAMKSTAYYICFSRGGIADDDALLKALQEGWIAGAGLDAHGVEPLPADSPFWTAQNTIVTPHNGATTPFTRRRGVDIFINNLRCYVAGQALMNVVDKQVGY